MFIYILLSVLPLYVYAECRFGKVFTGTLATENLKDAIRYCLEEDVSEDEYKNMNTWDVSGVWDMQNLFRRTTDSTYNYFWPAPFEFTDISKWDVGGVINMNGMFEGATTFNADLSKWDVSNVANNIFLDSPMFGGAHKFNSDLSNWNVIKITNMVDMFAGATSFEGIGLSNWDVSRVEKMPRMFEGAIAFREDLSKWQLSDSLIHGWRSDWRSDPEVPSYNLDICRQERLAAEGYRYCKLNSPNIDVIQSMFKGTNVGTLLCGDKWLEMNDGDFVTGQYTDNWENIYASISYLNKNVLQGQGDSHDNSFLVFNHSYPTAQISIGTEDTCRRCPPGTFGQVPTCQNCAVGYYTNQHNSTDCKACAVGKFQNVSGSTSCKYCDDGQWTGLNKGQSICVTVPDSVTVRDSVCGSGTTLVNNTCVASGSNSVCGSGTTLVNNMCVIATNTTEECGALKTIYNEGGCCN